MVMRMANIVINMKGILSGWVGEWGSGEVVLFVLVFDLDCGVMRRMEPRMVSV